MCQFIETLRIEEERIMNLEAHEKRMNDTIKDFFPQASRVDLRKHIMLQEHTTRTKCHIEYNNALLSVSYHPYHPRQVHSLWLTECNTINYSYKYKNRNLLQLLYDQRCHCDDILIVKNGFITDTSIANIAVYDGIQWYTPILPHRNYSIFKNSVRSTPCLILKKWSSRYQIKPSDNQFILLVNLLII